MTLQINKKGFTGFQIKFLALILMFIDHIYYFFEFTGKVPVIFSWIGRLAGGLFLFTMVEGYIHTSSKKRSRVAGQISKVEYTEGQLVHVGDPLVEIDPAPFQAAVTQAEGQLARDQASLELAKINLVRDTDLLNKGVVSKQEYDTQVATDHQSEGAVKLDQGNLDQAKVNLGLLSYYLAD